MPESETAHRPESREPALAAACGLGLFVYVACQLSTWLHGLLALMLELSERVHVPHAPLL